MSLRLPEPDAARLWARVASLSELTLPGSPWTRRAFSDLFLQSRDWLRNAMHAAGLTTQIDAGGNLIGRRAGRDPQLPPLMVGSHCDTVVAGGRFDGIIGVLAGIEIAQAANECGLVLDHPLEVVDFLSEEPSDYGISCIGSRAMTGVLDASMLAARRPDGQTLAEGLRRVGGRPELLQAPLRERGSIAAFVELHIEQGPVLEAQHLPIGVVTNIVGIRRASITLTGQPDHAGTTPMDIRRDALVGAAALVQEAFSRASAMSGAPHYVVATVGRLEVMPNVANAVPGRVELVLEVRSDAAEVLDGFVGNLVDSIRPHLVRLRVEIAVRPLSSSRPTACAPEIMAAITRAAASLGYASRQLPSGAGHDAAYLAACCPAGMIFIPCRDGRSHCPEEWIEPEQLADGARVLCSTLIELDQRLSPRSDHPHD